MPKQTLVLTDYEVTVILRGVGDSDMKLIADMLKLDGKTHILNGITLEEAYKQGWKLADTKWTLGYMSRKDREENEIPVYEAGGSRRGYIAYLHPSYRSTTYCHVTYLYHPDVRHL